MAKRKDAPKDEPKDAPKDEPKDAPKDAPKRGKYDCGDGSRGKNPWN
jgi:hypothetical protein